MPTVDQRKFFSKVVQARELLKEKAEEIIREYLDIAAQAKAAGDYESAYKSLQWLIEHMPKDTDGSAVAGRSVDKDALPAASTDQKPRIMIGINVGGVNQKALPKATVETIDAD